MHMYASLISFSSSHKNSKVINRVRYILNYSKNTQNYFMCREAIDYYIIQSNILEILIMRVVLKIYGKSIIRLFDFSLL